MKYYYIYKTKLGKIEILERNNKIEIVKLYKKDFIDRESSIYKETELIKRTSIELFEYFDGKRKEFSIDLNPIGSDFEKDVWNAMLDIPYGKTKTYKEIAKSIGRDKAYQAVGNACGKNPISIIIPCHRVVAINGIGGFSSGIDIKIKLHRLEDIEVL